MRHFQVDPDRCRVIPHGVETEFSLPVSGPVRAELTARYALPDRFLLQVGTVQPRKNYVTSLRALARIPAAQRIRYGDGPHEEPRLQVTGENRGCRG